jgi:hypothetical protein
MSYGIVWLLQGCGQGGLQGDGVTLVACRISRNSRMDRRDLPVELSSEPVAIVARTVQ